MSWVVRCDRCGQDSSRAAQGMANINLTVRTVAVDLCDECVATLDAWLNGRGGARKVVTFFGEPCGRSVSPSTSQVDAKSNDLTKKCG